MHITLLGHASVLVELDGATCLTDPVLGDPFEEGTVVSSPERTVDADMLPELDILFAMYASQNFEFFESRATGFPLETHQRNLETALRIDPTVVVPASAGIRFWGDHEWLNAFLFPVSRERFVADLRRLAPQVDARRVDPGDVLELTTGNEFLLHESASPVARTETHDKWRVAFDPAAPIPPLTDPNPDAYAPAHLERIVVDLVGALGDWVTTPSGRDDRVVSAYREYRVRYRVGLVFPDGAERRFDLDFSADPPQPAEVGVTEREIDLMHRIAASALAGWAEHRRSFLNSVRRVPGVRV